MVHLTSNKWVLAFPHALAMVASFYVLYRICLEDFETIWGPIIVFLLYTLNSNLVFHALEFRPYAVLPVLALLFYWRSRLALERDVWSFSDRLSWGFLIFLTMLFHFYGILMIGVILTYRVLSSRTPRPLHSLMRRPWMSTAALAGLLALPIWFYYLLPNVGEIHIFDPFEFGGHGPVRVMAFVLGNLGTVPVRWAWILEVLIVAASLVLPCPGRRDRWLWILVVIALPIGVIFFPDWLEHYWFLQRQFVWVIPFWSLLVGQAVEALIKIRRV